MTDVDEIPVSEAEKAFYDAMRALDDVRDTQAATTGGAVEQPADETALAKTVETTIESNGNPRDGSDDEVSVAKDSGAEQAQEGREESSAATSARNSVAPSVSSTVSVGDVAANGSAEVSTVIPPLFAIPKDESTENSTPAPATPAATPAVTQSPPKSKPIPQSAPAQKSTTGGKRKRLPQDLVGQLEDRIAGDPKGDVDAWLSLVEEHKRKGKFDDARKVYDRFFQIFPQAAQQWIDFVKMELNNNEFQRVEQVFSRCLLTVSNVDLWSLYLDYIRRRNNLTNDPAGKARGIISAAYEFVLNNVGMDKEAGHIWQDQIAFVKSAPGTVGGSTWMDQQKMDSLRRVYQKAITQPVNGVQEMWREYDLFEHGLNKITAKKFLQEHSPSFMTARACLHELSNITRGLRRETLPHLPPAQGYGGEEDWNYQVMLWKKWIQWEKDDPVVLAKDDPAALRNRILHAYKQALMALRFWPEMWFEAVEYCFSNDMDAQGIEFLKHGLQANPESTLLTFRYAERLEMTTTLEGGEAGMVRKGQIVRKPYDELLTNLYAHYAKMQAYEREEIEKLEEAMGPASPKNHRDRDDDDDDDEEGDANKITEKSINEVKEKSKVEMLKMSKVISAVWVNLMRAMRRIQGHGKVNEPLGGSRQIFADARKRGKITSDVYVASALIEYHCYRDPAALKIFERGMKLFPEDEDFALEYLKHLVNINDITNARAMFETFVSKVPAVKAQRVYRYFYEYEAHYGDLAQVYKLEKRMAELYPADKKLEQFSTRYAYHTVDPCNYLPTISPAQQARPKQLIPIPPEAAAAAGLPIPPPPIPPSASGGASGFHPHPPSIPPPNARTSSPKRAAADDSDDYSSRARKLPRPDSPVPILKGAAGRRLNQIKQQQAAAAAAAAEGRGGQQKDNRRDYSSQRRDGRDRDGNDGGRGGGTGGNRASEPSLPEAITNLLAALPPAHLYNTVMFAPEQMVRLLASVPLPAAPNAGAGAGGSYYGN